MSEAEERSRTPSPRNAQERGEAGSRETSESCNEKSASGATTLHGDDDEISAQYQQGRNWEGRGAILGLVIEAASRSAGQAMMLIPMLMVALSGDMKLLNCRQRQGMTGSQAVMCEYFTAYAVAFPVIATTGMMLVVGRNLLQKRLYYAMLQAGGVMTFGQNNPLADVLVWIVIWCYGHCLCYLIFVINTCFNEGTFEFRLGGGVRMEEEALKLIVGCVSMLILPSTLFTIFFYCAYDIEGTLLPLSQYVHDALDVADTQSPDQDQTALAALELMSDAITKSVLEDRQDEIFAIASNHEKKCGELLQKYLECENHYDEKEVQAVGLFTSFWPGGLLLKPDMTGAYAKRFKHLWFSLCSVVLLVFAILFCFIGAQLAKDAAALPQALPSLLVFLVHVFVLAAFCLPFFRTMMQAFEHSPLLSEHIGEHTRAADSEIGKFQKEQPLVQKLSKDAK